MLVVVSVPCSIIRGFQFTLKTTQKRDESSVTILLCSNRSDYVNIGNASFMTNNYSIQDECVSGNVEK